MGYPIQPLAITVDRHSHKMIIQWNDDHLSEYSFTLLRSACPCAECRGGHENMRAEPDPSVYDQPEVDTPATRLSNVEAVGAYAVTIEWEDGHHYGIYNWVYLRKLCPCVICRQAASNDQ
jgi:DUF971 family protein